VDLGDREIEGIQAHGYRWWFGNREPAGNGYSKGVWTSEDFLVDLVLIDENLTRGRGERLELTHLHMRAPDQTSFQMARGAFDSAREDSAVPASYRCNFPPIDNYAESRSFRSLPLLQSRHVVSPIAVGKGLLLGGIIQLRLYRETPPYPIGSDQLLRPSASPADINRHGLDQVKISARVYSGESFQQGRFKAIRAANEYHFILRYPRNARFEFFDAYADVRRLHSMLKSRIRPF
jgi:hypothetical protein